ncbi:MAG: hypothetical protein LUC93_02080 [Planctomycetaceae bacterium]|nr:hypothetical protein [Planctomycetaceae bacterium]
MVTKIAEKTVVLTRDGTALSVMERPEGLGTIDDFHKELVVIRKQYGHLLHQQPMDEYFMERRIEAEREWE